MKHTSAYFGKGGSAAGSDCSIVAFCSGLTNSVSTAAAAAAAAGLARLILGVVFR